MDSLSHTFVENARIFAERGNLQNAAKSLVHAMQIASNPVVNGTHSGVKRSSAFFSAKKNR